MGSFVQLGSKDTKTFFFGRGLSEKTCTFSYWRVLIILVSYIFDFVNWHDPFLLDKWVLWMLTFDEKEIFWNKEMHCSANSVFSIHSKEFSVCEEIFYVCWNLICKRLWYMLIFWVVFVFTFLIWALNRFILRQLWIL